MPDRTDCENLDQRFLEGADETELLESVAHCLGEEIKRFAIARCGSSRGDVEDISQDVLLAARLYLKSFRGEASLRTWLYRLVLSACSRRRRGRKNDPSLHAPLEDTEPTPDVADPEMVLMIGERLAALRQAMDGLRPEDRAMLAAVEWEGRSLQQVGEGLGLSVPAMKSRLFRIRRQLREKLAPQLGIQLEGEGDVDR
jgi:RNA polymerase sigma-70 factor (ECF subfamily)